MLSKSKKNNYKINHQIQAAQLRVLGEDGKQVGLMTKADALSKASEAHLDLIEIAPNANPPVAKIMQLGKFLYQEEKKTRRENKKSKGGELKEIRFSPFIGDNDYNTRLERIKEFLGEKNKVRLTVVFRTNQLRSKSFGYDILNRALRDLVDIAKEEVQPKFLGKSLTMIVTPISKKTNINKDKDAETQKQENNIETTQDNQNG